MRLKQNGTYLKAGENTPLEFDTALRTGTFIRLLKSGVCVLEISGLCADDFAAYELEGGTWTSPPPSEGERIAAMESALLALMMGGVPNAQHDV